MYVRTSKAAVLIAVIVGLGCSGSVTDYGSSGGTAGVETGGANSSGAANAGGESAGGSNAGGISGIGCGAVTCPAGQYCCNASCGVCAPMGAACIQIACVGSGGASSGVGSCSADADCSLYDDYCGGCNCRAFPANVAVDPICSPSQMNSCLVEPCLNKRAACTNGQCTVGG